MPTIVVGEAARRVLGTDISRGGGDIVACCHCPTKFQISKGSGTLRGFCPRCMARHCGKKSCWNCTPHDEDEYVGRRQEELKLARGIERKLSFGRSFAKVFRK